MSSLYFRNPLKRNLKLEPSSNVKDFSEVEGMLGTLYKKLDTIHMEMNLIVLKTHIEIQMVKIQEDNLFSIRKP